MSRKRERLIELIHAGAFDELLSDDGYPMITQELVKALMDNPALRDKLAAIWLQKAMAGDIHWFRMLVERTDGVKAPPVPPPPSPPAGTH